MGKAGQINPALDVGDVEDEHSHRQHRGYPDKPKIRRLIHDHPCLYKLCAKTPGQGLNFRIVGPDEINSP